MTTVEHRVDYLDLDEILPAPRNAKAHDLDALERSISHFGLAELPTLDDRTGRLVAGHGRIEDLRARRDQGDAPPAGVRLSGEGRWLVPVLRGWASRSDEDAEAYTLISNQATILGGWHDAELAAMLRDLQEADPALLELAGFTDDDLAELLAGDDDQGDGGGDGPAQLTEQDAIPEPAGDDAEAITRPGDLWLLGPHRLICGDTTDRAVVDRLVAGATLTMLHADPPYGMGKESEGIANDNLYRQELDAFQMLWWGTWRRHLAGNGSVYIWGQAPDLWRLWYTGGLGDDQELNARNEIVWDKTTGIGMRSAGRHCYPTASERCLFFMCGQQFLGNQNLADYWEGYEPLRAWLEAERDKVGWTNKDVNGLTGTHMAGHWFTKSQFIPIASHHYRILQEAAAGRAFTVGYTELFAQLFPEVRAGGNAPRRELSEEMRATRTHFDNTHDAMTDVWQFGRVLGEDRYGHATPKPVAMVERAILSSSREGDTIGVPFGGTGPEFIAAHRLGRVAVAAELHPAYVDVICRRYQEHTGVVPVLESTGEERNFTAEADDG